MKYRVWIMLLIVTLLHGCSREPELRESMLFTLSVKDNQKNDLLDTNYVGHFTWSEIKWLDADSTFVEFRISFKYGAFLLENISKLRENVDYTFLFPMVAPQVVRFEFGEFRMTDRSTNRDMIVRSIARVWWNGVPLVAEKGYFEVILNP